MPRRSLNRALWIRSLLLGLMPLMPAAFSADIAPAGSTSTSTSAAIEFKFLQVAQKPPQDSEEFDVQIRVVLLHQPAAAVPALGPLLASYQRCGPFTFETSSPLEFQLHVAR